MEMTRYAQTIARWWHLAVAVFVVTLVTTMVWTARQPALYESDGTFVVRPRTENREDAVRAIDTLVRGVEINATYAAIARSGMMRDRAEAAIEDELADLPMAVRAELVTGTNLLELAVVGRNPTAVYELATALSGEVTQYIEGLGDAYVLAPLDMPEEPDEPVSPRRTLTVLLGATLGLALAATLPLLAEYLRRGIRVGRGRNPDVLDEATMRRLLRIAVDRAGSAGQRLAFVTIRPAIDPWVTDSGDHLPQAVPDSLLARLRQTVQVGVLEDGTVVAALVEPGVDGLRRRLTAWRGDVADVVGVDADGDVTAAVCVYGPDEVSGDADAVRLLDRLAGPGGTTDETAGILLPADTDDARR